MEVFISILLLLLSQCFALAARADSNLQYHINQEIPVLTSKTQNLNPHVLKLALQAYSCAIAHGLDKRHLLTIIDYSLPDTDKRMWVINLNTNQILFNTLVAHGEGSGNINATRFSDITGTHESSLGLFITDNIYIGHDGYSLRIIGLEKGFNDMAFTRAIIIHGAPYVSEMFIRRYGRLGRSWGCPAVPLDVIRPLADIIKNGTLVFAYYPNMQWLKNSKYINCTAIIKNNTN